MNQGTRKPMLTPSNPLIDAAPGVPSEQGLPKPATRVRIPLGAPRPGDQLNSVEMQ